MSKVKLVFMMVASIGASASGLADDHAVKVSGDLRYRNEHIRKEETKYRIRDRIRARLHVRKMVEPNTTVGIGFATGSTSDPISRNVSLTGNSAMKGIGLDLAYFHYKCTEGMEIGGGKVKNPFIRVGKNQLIFDGDLNPEGLWLAHKMDLGVVSINPVFGRFWLREVKDANDAMLNGGQLAIGAKLANVGIKIGYGQYAFTQTKGQAFFGDESMGNVADDSGEAYKNPFKIAQVFLEVKADVGAVPLSLFYDSITNSDADDDNKGSVVGIAVKGKIGSESGYKVMLAQKSIEKDATVGAFTDSDFGGGGTDKKGMKYNVSWKANKAMALSVTHFENETAIDDGKKYGRTQIDLKFKF